MAARYLSICFPHLLTDWFTIKHPEARDIAFVFAAKVKSKLLVMAVNRCAHTEGIKPGMSAADAKALLPGLQVLDEKPGREKKLLYKLAEWCIRFTPVAAVDEPDGLMLDITGCAHLWGGEEHYLAHILQRLQQSGYSVKAGIADTIGTAWGIARFGSGRQIVQPAASFECLFPLPPAALRLEEPILDRLHKLGLNQIGRFIHIQRSALRRRFGDALLLRLDQASGLAAEHLEPVKMQTLFEVRLPCLEPIRTASGIEIAIEKLLENLCAFLRSEGQGLRNAVLTSYRIDGRILSTEIGTSRASHSITHLKQLFQLKIAGIEPALGIELFVLTATRTDAVDTPQEKIWSEEPGLNGSAVAELIDRIVTRIGQDAVHRYLPEEHYWPERAFASADSLEQAPATNWTSIRRPLRLLQHPEPIEVSVLLPDYPPILFLYKGETHTIKKADGPERIEREWWIEEGEHRDYYTVEDESGQRYWLFRSGHFAGYKPNQWFLHGFFA